MAHICPEQIAVMNQHYKNYSFDYFLNQQKRLGCQNLELWLGAPHFYMDRLGYEDCRKLKKKIEAYGLRIVSVTSSSFAWQHQYAVSGREFQNAAYSYFANGIQAAAELGAGIVTVNSGWGFWDESRDDAIKRSACMLFRLATLAEKAGIVLALESLTSEETELADTLERTETLWKQVGHPCLKVMVDTVACGFQGEMLEQWFDTFGEEIIHMHFVDFDQICRSDAHLAWGDGNAPLEEMLDCLERYHYQGYLVQEIVAGCYKNPVAADEQNWKVLRYYMEGEGNL